MGIHALLSTGGGTGDATSTVLDYFNSDVIDGIGSMVTEIFSWVTANPILTIFLTVSLVGIGFKVVGWLKGVVRLR